MKLSVEDPEAALRQAQITPELLCLPNGPSVMVRNWKSSIAITQTHSTEQ
jgi:hypothetical protein